MSPYKVLFSIAFGLIALTTTVSGDCLVCSNTSYAACINSTAYLVCPDGKNALSQIHVCPNNEVCTNEQGVCKQKTNETSIPCSTGLVSCERCSDKFACVSTTEFVFCDTDGNRTDIGGSCEGGKVCSIEAYDETSAICTLPCLYNATCSNTEATTVAPIDKNWKASCAAGTTFPGFYKNTQDSTCRTYVYCDTLQGLNAVLYTCDNGYFNAATTKCVTTKPNGC